jgi:hypothetical protein
VAKFDEVAPKEEPIYTIGCGDTNHLDSFSLSCSWGLRFRRGAEALKVAPSAVVHCGAWRVVANNHPTKYRIFFPFLFPAFINVFRAEKGLKVQM